MDYQAFGAVGRLLAVSSMFVTVVNNIWRHGDIDLTGRYANMRTIYLRAIAIGVVLAVVARLNILAMLRIAPAFDSYLGFTGSDLADEVIGVIVTGTVIGFLSKFWNDLFDLLFETKRFMRGKANQLRADDGPRQAREPRGEMGGRDTRDMRNRGRRGSRGGRPDRDRGDRPDRGDRGDRGERGDRGGQERGDRGGQERTERPGERPMEIRRPDFSREPSSGNS